MSHTPGPWIVVPAKRAVNLYIVADVNESSVADCSMPAGRPWGSPEEAAANARLIASAPTLLAALKAAKESGALSGRPYTLACEAIAKAEGRA